MASPMSTELKTTLDPKMSYETMFSKRNLALLFLAAAILLGTILLSKSAPEAFAAASIEFGSTDISDSQTSVPPRSGWSHFTLPAMRRPEDVLRGHSFHIMWARFRFVEHALPIAPLGVINMGIRDSFAAFLNGHQLGQSDLDGENRDLTWNRPHWLQLPTQLLRPGMNELSYRIASPAAHPLAIKRVQLGPLKIMRAAYNRLYYLDVVAPQIVNGVLAILSVGTLLCWCVRPRQKVFGWLALVGILWWFYNLQSYISAVPINVELFWMMTNDAVFALMAGVYGFAATFLEMPNRRQMIYVVALCCAGAALTRHLLLAFGLSDLPGYLVGLPIEGVITYVLAKACWRNPKIENIFMLVAVTISTMFGVNDLGLFKHLWHGTTFHLMPYGSLLVFSAFGLALARQVLSALLAVEQVNSTLKQRVASATTELALSENARRQLEVAGAIRVERERLMREIHDGIGSSLITALAVAERQHQPASAIATFKRSIADLRIAVDSLEPIEGDVVMLLASLRYRMERELRDAGLTFAWNVMPAPPLEWLDAVGALHILRILQEAIGNVLTHGQAKFVRVDCQVLLSEGKAGVHVAIRDDGCGFDTAVPVHGRGLANMHARAEALHAKLSIVSRRGEGTELVLWLPIERSSACNPRETANGSHL